MGLLVPLFLHLRHVSSGSSVFYPITRISDQYTYVHLSPVAGVEGVVLM